MTSYSFSPLHTFTVKHDLVQILGPFDATEIDDETGSVREILQMISSDGRIVLPDACNRVGDEQRFIDTLKQLVDHRFIVESDICQSNDQMLGTLDMVAEKLEVMQGNDPLLESLAKKSVGVFSPFNEFRSALSRHFRTSDSDVKELKSNDFLMVALPSSEHHNFLKWNKAATRSAIPTLFVSFDNHKSVIGPLYVPGQSSCYSCYSARVCSNDNFLTELFDESDVLSKHPKTVDSLLVREVTSRLVVPRIYSYFRELSSVIPLNEILEFDFISMSIRKGTLLRHSRCQTCGSALKTLGTQPLRAANVE